MSASQKGKGQKRWELHVRCLGGQAGFEPLTVPFPLVFRSALHGRHCSLHSTDQKTKALTVEGTHPKSPIQEDMKGGFLTGSYHRSKTIPFPLPYGIVLTNRADPLVGCETRPADATTTVGEINFSG